MSGTQGDIMVGSVKNMVDRLSRSNLTLQDPAPFPKKAIIPKPTQPARPQATVTFAYKATQSDELTLAVGDVIEIIKEVEEGWNEGYNTRTGESGMYPTNFTEPKPQPTPPMPKDDVVRRMNSSSGEDKSGPEVVKRTPSVIGASLPTFPPPAPTTATTAAPPPISFVMKKDPPKEEVKTKEMAKVKFTYKAEHSDELNLPEVGALIEIRRKDCGDPGWFEGELNGKVGLFPDNFVELVKVPVTSTSGSPKLQAKESVNIRAPAKAPIIPPSGNIAMPPAVPAKPSKPKLSDSSSNLSTATIPTTITGAAPTATASASSTSTATAQTTSPTSSLTNMPSVSSSRPGAMSFNDIRSKLNGFVIPKPGDPMPKNMSQSTTNISASPNEERPVGEGLDDAPRLSHVTKDRPRNPNRRPQSMVATKVKKNSVDDILEKSPSTTSDHASPFFSVNSGSHDTTATATVAPLQPSPVRTNPSSFTMRKDEPVKEKTAVTASLSYNTSLSTSGTHSASESDFVTRKEYNDLMSKYLALEARVAALERR